MSNIAATAERLRAVREAQKLFLTLWEVERSEKTQSLLDRVALDVDRLPARSGLSEAGGLNLCRDAVLDDEHQ